MSDEKRPASVNQDSNQNADEKQKTSPGSRARNRTVMLTPEMTGQVRALLYQDPEEEQADSVNDSLQQGDWSRPEGSGTTSLQERAKEGADFGKDFSAARQDSPRPERRGGSTGKIDVDAVNEVISTPLSRPSDTFRRPGPVSNPGNAPRSPGLGVATGGIGVGRKSPSESRQRPSSTNLQAAVQAPTSRVIGFLVSYDKEKNGEVHQICAGRWLITSRPTDHGEYILIRDETVSPLHAIVRATQDGKVQILDQLSEFGTGVQRVGTDAEQEVAGAMVAVDHGDIVRLGKRRFVVCLVPKTGTANEGGDNS